MSRTTPFYPFVPRVANRVASYLGSSTTVLASANKATQAVLHVPGFKFVMLPCVQNEQLPGEARIALELVVHAAQSAESLENQFVGLRHLLRGKIVVELRALIRNESRVYEQSSASVIRGILSLVNPNLSVLKITAVKWFINRSFYGIAYQEDSFNSLHTVELNGLNGCTPPQFFPENAFDKVSSLTLSGSLDLNTLLRICSRPELDKFVLNGFPITVRGSYGALPLPPAKIVSISVLFDDPENVVYLEGYLRSLVGVREISLHNYGRGRQTLRVTTVFSHLEVLSLKDIFLVLNQAPELVFPKLRYLSAQNNFLSLIGVEGHSARVCAVGYTADQQLPQSVLALMLDQNPSYAEKEIFGSPEYMALESRCVAGAELYARQFPSLRRLDLVVESTETRGKVVFENASYPNLVELNLRLKDDTRTVSLGLVPPVTLRRVSCKATSTRHGELRTQCAVNFVPGVLELPLPDDKWEVVWTDRITVGIRQIEQDIYVADMSFEQHLPSGVRKKKRSYSIIAQAMAPNAKILDSLEYNPPRLPRYHVRDTPRLPLESNFSAFVAGEKIFVPLVFFNSNMHVSALRVGPGCPNDFVIENDFVRADASSLPAGPATSGELSEESKDDRAEVH